MNELLVDCFEMVNFLAHRVDLGQHLLGLFCQGAQLFRCHGEKVMPLIVPEQTTSGVMAGATVL